jgi:hypothetical protein
MMRVIVSGALANKPFNGGEAWVRLSWLRGLERLGCDVFFLEQIAPDTCVDACGAACTFADSVNRAYFHQVVSRFGLDGRAALACSDERSSSGATLAEIEARCASADLLVNISGHLRLPRFFDRIRRSAYIDIDPGYTQMWCVSGLDPSRVADHQFAFTIGENIGRAPCTIPTGGVQWRPTRQPVVLDDWPVVPSRTSAARFTTVSSWRGAYGRVEHEGRTFGQKAHEFRKLCALPRHVDAAFELALDIHDADAPDRTALADHGWTLTDPRGVASTPDAFRDYVQQSSAECSAAQGVYVDTRSGWFSDRSVRYLASGRPVLVQDTGFGGTIPTGDGLVPFRTLDEAADGARDIVGHYERHAAAARRLAETHFESSAVIGRLLDDMGMAPR